MFLLFSLQVDNVLPGIRAMYIFSIGTLLFASIGLYGACKEKKWALIMVGKEKHIFIIQF